MLHAKPSESFFEYSSSAGLDGDACRLILNRLDDDICARFLGNATVGEGFYETTAAHVVRTYQNLETHLGAILPESRDTDLMLENLKSKIMIHDTSDILRENIVASTEVDPEMKQKLAQNIDLYDMIVTPFTYKLALFANKEKQPALFDETIFALRESTILPEQIGRQLRMEEVMEFTMKSIHAVSAKEQEFSRFAAWDNAESLEKTDAMLIHYHSIERAIDFTGTQAQIHEKCDGTDYSLSISAYKQQHNLAPNIFHVPTFLTNRINNRFEKNLGYMIGHAGHDHLRMMAAAATINYCYGISEKSFAMGKDVVSLNPQANEPDIMDAQNIHDQFHAQQIALCQSGSEPDLMPKENVVALYQEARHELQKNGVLWLPENGKTLLASTDIQKIMLPNTVRPALEKLHI